MNIYIEYPARRNGEDITATWHCWCMKDAEEAVLFFRELNIKPDRMINIKASSGEKALATAAKGDGKFAVTAEDGEPIASGISLMELARDMGTGAIAEREVVFVYDLQGG